MAKGQKRSSRELKKPKQVKAKPAAGASQFAAAAASRPQPGGGRKK